ncbi:hypothetical protein [Rhizobium leguminosarum]|nr:hypothetical protein [Rhizobium leguminosarum]WFT86868.1 hypothetical protein QA638_04415 [Rhizobium leguminosarum]
MGILVTSAVAGVGLSFGRDVYRNVTKNLVAILVLGAALFGTAYGFFSMVRGYDRSPLETFFKTFLLNTVIIVVSLAVFTLAAGYLSNGKPSIIPVFVLLAQVAVGILLGSFQRPKRMKAIAVDRDNQVFLESNGFRDVGGREKTMLDANDNELVLDDFRRDAIVFKVKGRRGVRAKILVDGDGRMTQYVPA